MAADHLARSEMDNLKNVAIIMSRGLACLGRPDSHTCESTAAGGWKHDLSWYETAEIAVRCPWS
jgi:hypothetical protein